MSGNFNINSMQFVEQVNNFKGDSNNYLYSCTVIIYMLKSASVMLEILLRRLLGHDFS